MSWEDRFDKTMEGLDRTMEGLDKRLDKTFNRMDDRFEKFHKKVDKFSGTIKVGDRSRIVVNGKDVTAKFKEMEKRWDAEKKAKKQTTRRPSNVVHVEEEFTYKGKGSRLVVYARYMIAIVILIIFIAIGSSFYALMTQKKYEPKQFDKTPPPIEQPIKESGGEKRL